MGKIRVAIAGLGNCASALIQGVHYYRNEKPDTRVPGLMHVKFGDYHVKDIEFFLQIVLPSFLMYLI
jgi:myo-inositol-1-phosphate synthase